MASHPTALCPPPLVGITASSRSLKQVIELLLVHGPWISRGAELGFLLSANSMKYHCTKGLNVPAQEDLSGSRARAEHQSCAPGAVALRFLLLPCTEIKVLWNTKGSSSAMQPAEGGTGFIGSLAKMLRLLTSGDPLGNLVVHPRFQTFVYLYLRSHYRVYSNVQ